MSEKFKSTYRGYLIDHHSPDPPVVTLDKLDPNAYAQFFEEANINQLMLYCKDHWGSSYYDTEVGRKHPGLGSRDWVAELVPVLRKHNIEFTAYYCFEYDSYAPTAHPEWSVLTAEGIPLRCGMPTNTSNAKWGIPCLHTGYRDYVLNQLREIVTRYHPDSLFIDIFGMTLCYCDTCRKLYRDRFGYDIPETDQDRLAHNLDVVSYLDDEAEKMLDDVRAAVLAIDPELAVTINFSAHYPKKIRDKLDYLFTEPWAGNWLSGAYARDTSGGKPFQLGPGEISQVYNYQPDTVYELATAEIAAQNSRVFMYSESMHFDGTLEMEEARKVGKAYREIEKFEPYLTNREIHADIAIVQSDDADILRATEPVQIRCVGRALVNGPHRQAILGAMELCDRSMKTWRVVPELELDFQRMCSYKMIILPNLFHIRAQLADDLRRYVRQGGCLLVTGESGMYDSVGQLLPDFTLADLMGCHLVQKDETFRKNVWCAYVQQTDDPVWNGSAKTTAPVGPYILRTTADGGRALGHFIDPAVLLTDQTWVNWGYPLPGHPNGQTAIYEHTVGKGKVLTTCFDLCTMASKDYIWTRSFFLGLLEQYLTPSVALDTPYPNSLEFTCYTRNKELLIHELSAMARLTGGDTPMLPGGTLRIADTFRQIIRAEQVYPDQQSLVIHHDEKSGCTDVELPPLRLHSIFRLLTR